MEIDLEAPETSGALAKQEADAMTGTLLAVPINSPETEAWASECIKAVRDEKNRLNEERMTVTRPLDQAKTRVMDWFRPAVDGLGALENELRKRVDAYRAKVRAEQQAALLEATSKEEVTAAVEAVAPQPAGRGERTTYTMKVVDWALLPERYKIADLRTLNQIAKRTKTEFDIPGCELVATVAGVYR